MLFCPSASAIVLSSAPLSRRMTATVCRSQYRVRPGPMNPFLSRRMRSVRQDALKPLRVHGVPLELAQIAYEKAALRSPCEEKREHGLDVIRKTPALPGSLVANAHNKRAVETP